MLVTNTKSGKTNIILRTTSFSIPSPYVHIMTCDERGRREPRVQQRIAGLSDQAIYSGLRSSSRP